MVAFFCRYLSKASALWSDLTPAQSNWTVNSTKSLSFGFLFHFFSSVFFCLRMSRVSSFFVTTATLQRQRLVGWATRKFVLSASFLCTFVLSPFPTSLTLFRYTDSGIPRSRVNYLTKERKREKEREVEIEEGREERAGDGSLGIYK